MSMGQKTRSMGDGKASAFLQKSAHRGRMQV
jgi:hypothetical protein